MKPIRLLYAKNVISRKTDIVQQEMEFFILVENLAYDKQIIVFWAGEDGIWNRLKAGYCCPLGQNLELWWARTTYRIAPGCGFPKNIRFVLRYRVAGKEFWDNNDFRDYFIDSDSGIMIRNGISLLNVEFSRTLHRGQRFYPVSVAVYRSIGPKKVSISWTTDDWKTHYQTPCSLQRDYWHSRLGSHAANPNRYGWEIWTTQIGIGDAYRVEYAVSCDTARQKIWDNNFGRNYLARRENLKILTLNLHCYQEERQDDKFSQIAKAISDLKIDMVCLQEVGENWNDGAGDWKSNAAKIIKDRLKRSHHLSYHLYTDWSHIGFNRYREGAALLSRYKFLHKDSRYVSAGQDARDIHARKVVMAQVHIPYMGLVNVFSVHLSWWSEGFGEQFENLRRWANQRHTDDVAATLLCGDFNSKPGSQGYLSAIGTKEYEDQFLAATSRDASGEVFKQSSVEWEDRFKDDHRIDYIFMKKGSKLRATSGRVLFTEHDYGRVSDHCGYYTEFEPT